MGTGGHGGRPHQEEWTMTKVSAQMSVSLDGFYTGPRVARDVHGWMEGPEAPGFFRVTRWAVDAMGWRERLGFAGGERSIDSEIIEETFAAAGAYVMGRRMFDAGEVPWGEEPPFRAPVFVVTHRARDVVERRGGTSFTFVTDGPERAIELAREAAGGKDVAVAGGGELLRQVLAAGLLDQLELHIAPVLLGDGQRLFDGGLGLGAGEGLELIPTRVVEAPAVTHIRYTVSGRSQLVLDDRGASGELVGTERRSER
jgi:dihydrofolate reductase